MAKEIRIKLKVDSNTGELIIAQKEFGKLSKTIDKSAESTKSFSQTIKGLAGYAAVAWTIKQGFDAIVFAAKDFTNTASDFEKYGATLETIEGSSTKAKESLKWIGDFAKQTPYELDQVTEAFVQMRAYGLNPTNGSLKSLGDAASAMNKPLIQAVEAMADAMTGENERLKEFGIKASQKGQEIAYNWTDSSGKAKHIIIQNNSEIIQSTLESIFNSKYQDAMKNQMSTYGGMISNIKDQWTQFKKDFMDAGLFAYIKAFIKTFTESFTKSFALVSSEHENFTNGIIEGFNSTIDAVGFLYRAFMGLKTVFNVVYLGWLGFRASILGGLNGLTTAINKIIEGYNYVTQKITFKGDSISLDLLPDFKNEMEYIKEEAKKTGDAIGDNFNSAVLSTEKIATFKTTLIDNYKQIKDETDKIVGSIKPPVSGALDGQFQFGSGSSGGTSGASNKTKSEPKEKINTEPYDEHVKSYEDFMDKKSKITENFNDDYNRSLMTQTEYELSELTNQRDFYNEYVDDKLALDKWYDAEKKQIMDNRASSEKTAVEGIKDSFKEYVKESQDTYTQVNHMFTNGLYGMEDALVDFITTGKASFSDFINSIAADFVRMMVKMNITSPLASAASSVNWGSMLSSFAFANGGIMSSQGAVPLRAYSSGGIANSPQLALYGEGRMNEAYVPLPDGKTIPVTMSGSSSGATTLILNIENNSGQAIDAKQISQMTSTDSEGRKTEVLSIVIDAYNRNLMQLRDTLKGGR